MGRVGFHGQSIHVRREVGANAIPLQNHVNNVTYIRYAETARVNWAYNFAMHIDPEHKREWSEMCTPRGDGMILKSIKTDYKFVRAHLASYRTARVMVAHI
jgi:acyl-CoA thioesterase FadM